MAIFPASRIGFLLDFAEPYCAATLTATTRHCGRKADAATHGQDDRGRTLMRRVVLAVVLTALAASMGHAEPALDYGFYKRKVEPIFLKKRGDHARCAVCHQLSNNAFRLEKLPAGASFWTKEQSKKNFAMVSTLVVPGDPAQSRLLLQPLAPQAGGNAYHSGGWQFASKNDPDWKTLEAWVRGRKK
jgi:hypothetical protein